MLTNVKKVIIEINTDNWIEYIILRLKMTIYTRTYNSENIEKYFQDKNYRCDENYI